jgi:dihydrofolate synthase/folylpolyglutamate synthase
MPITRYDAALESLFSATDYEKMRHVRYNADTFSLDRMRRLLTMLGEPERRLRSVHVAGTKGKGSTSAMIETIAREGGLRTGLYTSPHLVDLRERIRVGGEMIGRDDLAGRIDAARPAIEQLRSDGDPATFFEIFTALALAHFAAAEVDLAVVEVGLGGRLDATSVLVPEVSVITAISFDHMAQLGHTLAAIAGEKAGIVKPGVPVVSQPQPPEALAVIERACATAGSPLTLIGRDVTWTWTPVRNEEAMGGRMTIATPRATYENVFVPLMGEHQAINAATAVAAAELSATLAGRLTPDLVCSALGKVVWPGRMEYVAKRPAMILDGAHNRASLEVLAAALHRHFPGRRMAILFGAAADKDLDGMMAAFVEKMPDVPVIFTLAASPRAADPSDLAARYARAGGKGAVAVADLASALAAAQQKVPPDGLIVVCGSLYLVGELKRWM